VRVENADPEPDTRNPEPGTQNTQAATGTSPAADEEFLPDFVTIYFPTQLWRRAAGKFSLWGTLLLVLVVLIGSSDLLGFLISATAHDPQALEKLGLSRPGAFGVVRVVLETAAITLVAWIIIKQRGRVVAYRLAEGIERGTNGFYWKFRPGFLSLPLGGRALARTNRIGRWDQYTGYEIIDHPWVEGVRAVALTKAQGYRFRFEADVPLMYDKLSRKARPERLFIPYDPEKTDIGLVEEYLLDVFEPLEASPPTSSEA
jgi:hypothetical protein